MIDVCIINAVKDAPTLAIPLIIRNVVRKLKAPNIIIGRTGIILKLNFNFFVTVRKTSNIIKAAPNQYTIKTGLASVDKRYAQKTTTEAWNNPEIIAKRFPFDFSLFISLKENRIF